MRAPSRWLPVLGLVLLGAGVVGLLLPLLSWYPSADDRYQYLLALQGTDGTLTGIVAQAVDELDSRIAQGRVTPVGFILQDLFYVGVSRLSVGTGMPVPVGHALVKVLVLALAVLTVRGWRHGCGSPGAASPTGSRPGRYGCSRCSSPSCSSPASSSSTPSATAGSPTPS